MDETCAKDETTADLVQDEESELVCSKCSYICKTKAKLLSHVRQVHVKWDCPVCNLNFATSAKLKNMSLQSIKTCTNAVNAMRFIKMQGAFKNILKNMMFRILSVTFAIRNTQTV